MGIWEARNHHTHEHNEIVVSLEAYEIAQLWLINRFAYGLPSSIIRKPDDAPLRTHGIAMHDRVESVAKLFS